MNISSQQRKIAVSALNESLWSLYSSSELGESLSEFAKKNDLTSDVQQYFTSILGDTILGFHTTAELPQLLQTEVGLTPQQSFALMADLADFLKPVYDREAGKTPPAPTPATTETPSVPVATSLSVTSLEEGTPSASAPTPAEPGPSNQFEPAPPAAVPEAVVQSSSQDELLELRQKFAATAASTTTPAGPPAYRAAVPQAAPAPHNAPAPHPPADPTPPPTLEPATAADVPETNTPAMTPAPTATAPEPAPLPETPVPVATTATKPVTPPEPAPVVQPVTAPETAPQPPTTPNPAPTPTTPPEKLGDVPYIRTMAGDVSRVKGYEAYRDSVPAAEEPPAEPSSQLNQ